jgi:EAL domain-containing protein (putative c-di-GMP-specific phosphodiesterase class I)
VRTIVQLGKELNLEVVAEGIETIAQWEYLTAEHVDAGQGYLFSRPLSAEAAENLLKELKATVDALQSTGPSLVSRSA